MVLVASSQSAATLGVANPDNFDSDDCRVDQRQNTEHRRHSDRWGTAQGRSSGRAEPTTKLDSFPTRGTGRYRVFTAQPRGGPRSASRIITERSW
jgi:hypothetical protein